MKYAKNERYFRRKRKDIKEIENVNDNCATFRILIQTDTGYTLTNNFFTINLKCISSIKCLGDVLITGL